MDVRELKSIGQLKIKQDIQSALPSQIFEHQTSLCNHRRQQQKLNPDHHMKLQAALAHAVSPTKFKGSIY